MDENMRKIISKCFINPKSRFRNEVFVIYEDGTREVIFGYDPYKLDYDYNELIGKSKIEAIFEYDRKLRGGSRH